MALTWCDFLVWQVITRHNFDAEIPLPELVDYYMPGFKACVQEGRALGIMCSYNAVNGVPMCANQKLLADVLRGEWGFDGYVTSVDESRTRAPCCCCCC